MIVAHIMTVSDLRSRSVPYWWRHCVGKDQQALTEHAKHSKPLAQVLIYNYLHVLNVATGIKWLIST